MVPSSLYSLSLLLVEWQRLVAEGSAPETLSPHLQTQCFRLWSLISQGWDFEMKMSEKTIKM